MAESTTFYNLFKCMYHIEALGHPGYKDRLWKHLCDYNNVANDVMVEIWNEPEPEGNEDVKLLFDTFNIKEESMNFYISW